MAHRVPHTVPEISLVTSLKFFPEKLILLLLYINSSALVRMKLISRPSSPRRRSTQLSSLLELCIRDWNVGYTEEHDQPRLWGHIFVECVCWIQPTAEEESRALRRILTLNQFIHFELSFEGSIRIDLLVLRLRVFIDAANVSSSSSTWTRLRWSRLGAGPMDRAGMFRTPFAGVISTS